jgi:hypothetical protein
MKRMMISATLVGGLLFGMSAPVGAGPEAKARADAAAARDREQFTVYATCRFWVKERLAPRSAKFVGPVNWNTGAVREAKTGRWVVEGLVDTENRFNARVRRPFQCVFTDLEHAKVTIGPEQ